MHKKLLFSTLCLYVTGCFAMDEHCADSSSLSEERFEQAGHDECLPEDVFASYSIVPDMTSALFVSARHTDRLDGDFTFLSRIASKAHLGKYNGGDYLFDSRLMLIDYDPTVLPCSLKNLLRDQFHFDLVSDRAHIEFDAAVWQLEDNFEKQESLAHNIVLHGLVDRWRGKASSNFTVSLSAAIGDLRGVVAVDMPKQLRENNFYMLVHDDTSLSPCNGQWKLLPDRSVGSFWLVAVYDPALDYALTSAQRAQLHRKALVSFITVIKPTAQNQDTLKQLFSRLNVSKSIFDVFDALTRFKDNLREFVSKDDGWLIFDALTTLHNPERAVVNLGTEFVMSSMTSPLVWPPTVEEETSFTPFLSADRTARGMLQVEENRGAEFVTRQPVVASSAEHTPVVTSSDSWVTKVAQWLPGPTSLVASVVGVAALGSIAYFKLKKR